MGGKSCYIKQVHMHESNYKYTQQESHWQSVCIQYIKILLVCLSVHDGCGRGRNGFAGRVQNHHVCFSFHRNGIHNTFLR